MKPLFSCLTCSVVKNFQFLWGWNRPRVTWEGRAIKVVKTFNSFEDETQPFTLSIQGTDITLSIPLTMKHTQQCVCKAEQCIFQFLWGWNKAFFIKTWYRNLWTFNSFEDETQGHRQYWRWGCSSFQFLWRWNYLLDFNLPSKYIAFNSFEDETDPLLFSLLYSRG